MSVTLNGMDACVGVSRLGHRRAAQCTLLYAVNAENRDAALANFRRVSDGGVHHGLSIEGVADLGFLSEFPMLRYLEIRRVKGVLAESLRSLSNLRGLWIESPASGIDFGWFPWLEIFGGEWHRDHRNVGSAPELRRLCVHKFRPASRDLSEFAGAFRVEELELVETGIASLSGIEEMEDLRYVSVAYAPKLESLDALAARRLGVREIEIESARRIASYRPLAAIPRLRRLVLVKCANMPDLAWMRGMEYLDRFVFVESTVESGDLTPLLRLPRLREASLDDKRHYSHTSAELTAAIERKRGS